jgi:hypothetical protein
MHAWTPFAGRESVAQNDPMEPLELLAGTNVLGALLEKVRARYGGFELVAHWTQGEFHHDVVLRLQAEPFDLPGAVLVVATNCNGGIKEVLAFSEVPDRWALWNHRCPDNPDFEGVIPELLGLARTHHWFNPCELLEPGARSELLPEHRRRQRGGGWEPAY